MSRHGGAGIGAVSAASTRRRHVRARRRAGRASDLRRRLQRTFIVSALSETEVELIPYGCTRLRLSEFALVPGTKKDRTR